MSRRAGIRSLDTDSLLVRFARFTLAGTGGFVVQIATVAVLTSLLNVNYLIATLVAVERRSC